MVLFWTAHTCSSQLQLWFIVAIPVAHTPDNSFLGFVSAEEAREEKQKMDANREKRIAVVYGKQEYMWQVWGIFK